MSHQEETEEAEVQHPRDWITFPALPMDGGGEGSPEPWSMFTFA